MRCLGTPARVVVIGVALLFCAATSPPRYTYPRNYPAWRIEGATTRVTACGEVRVWVSKSGKEGVGVTVRVHAVPERTCELKSAEYRDRSRVA